MSRHTRMTPKQIEALKAGLQAGRPVRELARELSVPRSTVADAVARLPTVRAAERRRRSRATPSAPPARSRLDRWRDAVASCAVDVGVVLSQLEAQGAPGVIVPQWWFDGSLKHLDDTDALLAELEADAVARAECPACLACTEHKLVPEPENPEVTT